MPSDGQKSTGKRITVLTKGLSFSVLCMLPWNDFTEPFELVCAFLTGL